MSRVSIVKCENYDYERAKSAIRESLDLLGGISMFIHPGDKVLLKVNLLMKRKPERVTTTHPSFAQAIAELVTEARGIPIIGDCPDGYHINNNGTLEAVYETCGMKDAAECAPAVVLLKP